MNDTESYNFTEEENFGTSTNDWETEWAHPETTTTISIVNNWESDLHLFEVTQPTGNLFWAFGAVIIPACILLMLTAAYFLARRCVAKEQADSEVEAQQTEVEAKPFIKQRHHHHCKQQHQNQRPVKQQHNKPITEATKTTPQEASNTTVAALTGSKEAAAMIKRHYSTPDVQVFLSQRKSV